MSAKVNLLNKSGAPSRGDLNLNSFEMSVVADDHSGLTDGQRFLVDFFEGKTGGKRFACRDDLDPAEIIKYLPYITIFELDINDEGMVNDLKVRLFGTAMSDFYGEWTGRVVKNDIGADSLKQTFPDSFNRILAMTSFLLEKRMPIILESEQVSDDRPYWQVKNLAIPFSQSGSDIDMMFMYVELTN